VSEAKDDDLQRLAFNMRDEARRDYARLTIEAHAAGLVADGHSKGTPETNLELARHIARAAALNDARSVFEDFPEELLKVRDRWLVVDALETAAGEASEEVSRYKRSAGLDS
jgi:hypothetical protein